MKRVLEIASGHGHLSAHLELPPGASGLVVAASLHAPGDAFAELARTHALASCCVPLLTLAEIAYPDRAHNVPLLSERLLHTLAGLARDGDTADLPLGLFSVAAAAPAAIRAAARRDSQVRCVVCHGGQLESAGRQYLEILDAPLLMLVDRGDTTSLAAYRRACVQMPGETLMREIEPDAASETALAWMASQLRA